jgi:serine/threonine-protein kinase HipA
VTHPGRDERYARFEYDPEFAAAGIEVAPLRMPVAARRIYQFRDLEPRSFHGLPGLLADSLPDKYGNRLIDVWLARTGRTPDQFHAVDRLCYTGTRGMGALEFEPSTAAAELADRRLDMKQLGVPPMSMEQQFRRVLFNLVGCNQDDHVKNFAFLMDRHGRWDIAPAYDLCHAEGSDFTARHQLSIAGKTTGFTRADLKELADHAGLPRGRERRLLDEVVAAFAGWQALARELGVPQRLVQHVQSTLRLSW